MSLTTEVEVVFNQLPVMKTLAICPVGSITDMQIVCAGNATVAVSSKLLRQATFSEAIADVIGLLRQQSPTASAKDPIKWELSQDQAPVWAVVCKMVEKPMAMAKDAGLTWVRIPWCVSIHRSARLQCVRFVACGAAAGQPG